jgi:hypothetical protein
MLQAIPILSAIAPMSPCIAVLLYPIRKFVTSKTRIQTAYIAPEVMSFCLLISVFVMKSWTFVFWGTVADLLQFTNTDGYIGYVIATFFSAAYAVEILAFEREAECNPILVLHHAIVIVLYVLASAWVRWWFNDPFTVAMVFVSTTLMLLHAAIDWLPHLWLSLRATNSRNNVWVRVCGHMCVWPLYTFRLCVNAYTIAFCMRMVTTVPTTPERVCWFVIVAIGVLGLLMPQTFVALTLYPKLLQKDRKNLLVLKDRALQIF